MSEYNMTDSFSFFFMALKKFNITDMNKNLNTEQSLVDIFWKLIEWNNVSLRAFRNFMTSSSSWYPKVKLGFARGHYTIYSGTNDCTYWLLI